MTSDADTGTGVAGGHEGDTAAFFTALFAGVPEGQYLALFALPGERSRFVRSAQAAETAVELLRPHFDVYAGVGTRARDLGPHRRGGAADVAALLGLWADIDIAGPAHTDRKVYPPDEEAARGLLSAMPLQPTLIVHSGHGLQAWWLFAEAYELETAAERARLEATSRGWAALLAEKAAARGWNIDMVWDLARVLRVPGTWNRKLPDASAPVRLVSAGGPRFAGPSEFEEWAQLAGLHGGRRGAPRATAGLLVMDPRAAPPFELFEALRANDPRFVQTWERRRRDLPDQSPSAYDLALANAAVAAGWEDQAICDLLIAGRRKHGDDLKLREDYYARTIARARETAGQRAALAGILTNGGTGSSGSAGAGADSAPEATPDELRAQARQAVSRALGLPVARWLQHNREQSRYTLVLEDGRDVAVGSVEAVTSITRFNNAVVEALGRAVPLLKRAEWWAVVTALGQMVEVIETVDATRMGALRDWLRSYLAETREDSRAEPWKLVSQQLPFYEGGDVWVHLRAFRLHILRVGGEQIDTPDLADMLREAGFRRRQRAARIPEERRNGRSATVNASYWHAPRTVLDEPGAATEGATDVSA